GEPTVQLTLTALDGGNPEKLEQENLPVGFLVLQLLVSDKDEGSNAQIRYYFSNIPLSANQKFSLDSTRGMISLVEPLDFEENTEYVMTVAAKDGGGSMTHCKVELKLLNENDNLPEIMFATVFSPILEDSQIGTVIALINVHDWDTGNNGKIVCYLEDDLPFKILPSADSYYTLLTDKPLDREKASQYNITITAIDKGTPPLNTNKTIVLQIPDINDNAPAFEKASYSIYVPENNPSGASIFQIQAFDPDLDQNSHITYSILTSNIEELPISSYISIHSETGIIYAQRSFDYEQFREFQLQVKAQDGGSPPLSSNVTVRVFILDRNDNSPQILSPSPDSKDSALFEMVPRSAEADYLVTKVVAVDADSRHNAWLSYQKDGSKYTELVINNPLDRESEPYIHLILTAIDGGEPRKTGTAHIWINVTDANDNSPIFTQELYKVRLEESLPIGSPVLQVIASDKDDGTNAQIRYHFGNMPGNNHPIFHLNPVSGKITLMAPLDFEETAEYTMTVVAKDGGGLEANSNIEIKICDENDNAPEINLVSLFSSFSEDTPPETLIALISVNDKDADDNGKVTCHLENDIPFKILPFSNNYYKLLIDRPLDRERISKYNITITATDKGTPPLNNINVAISLFLPLNLMDILERF
uniref:Cadherin domain-containing protein n=1 Tax=Pseudonaja textilis TaxID=8673 RepID=A0A670ZC59_PSETE